MATNVDNPSLIEFYPSKRFNYAPTSQSLEDLIELSKLRIYFSEGKIIHYYFMVYVILAFEGDKQQDLLT